MATDQSATLKVYRIEHSIHLKQKKSILILIIISLLISHKNLLKYINVNNHNSDQTVVCLSDKKTHQNIVSQLS